MENEDDFINALEKRCPPGLWCGKKRTTTGDNLVGSNEEEGELSLKTFEKRCPPGLWCGKKRTIATSASTKNQLDV